MPIKNFYTANSAEPDDIFVCVVTCHIGPTGYRLYRCEWPPQVSDDNVPQGSAMYNTKDIISQLFPIVKWANIPER